MDKSQPKVKGIRTAIQALAAFVVGLFVTVWAVPGVPDAITQYLLAHWMELVASLGLSTGLAAGILSFIQNYLEDRRG